MLLGLLNLHNRMVEFVNLFKKNKCANLANALKGKKKWGALLVDISDRVSKPHYPATWTYTDIQVCRDTKLCVHVATIYMYVCILVRAKVCHCLPQHFYIHPT